MNTKVLLFFILYQKFKLRNVINIISKFFKLVYDCCEKNNCNNIKEM